MFSMELKLHPSYPTRTGVRGLLQGAIGPWQLLWDQLDDSVESWRISSRNGPNKFNLIATKGRRLSTGDIKAIFDSLSVVG